MAINIHLSLIDMPLDEECMILSTLFGVQSPGKDKPLLLLIPVQANLVLGAKTVNLRLETNVAIRVMSIKKEKEQDQKVSCKPPKILKYFNIIPIIILYLTV